jgi:Cytochrome P450
MHFPWLAGVLYSLPRWLVEYCNPMMAHIFSFEDEVETRIGDVASGGNKAHKEVTHPTIFKEVLDSNLPPKEKTVDRMRHEGVMLVSAAIHTTKWVLSIAMVHVLQSPNILQMLKNELFEAWPNVDDPPTFQQLEQMPYLTAVIQEGKSSIS